MGVETEDVEDAYKKALDAIAEAKGRVTQSDLKRFDAGQFAATIVCEVVPDAAGPLRDRFKQLGRVARLDIERRQTTAGGTGAPTVKVERKDAQFQISFYNLANIAARETVHVSVACTDVEAAFKAILARVQEKGRVVTSHLDRKNPEQTTGTMTFEIKSADADAVLADVRATGDVMQLTVTENPDAQNVTAAKQGFSVQLVALASVQPRETTTLSLAARNVAEAFRALKEAAAKGRILGSQLNEGDRSNITASLDFELSRDEVAAVEKALADAGETVTRTIQRSNDAVNTVDRKVRYQVTVVDVVRLAPYEVARIVLAARDVPGAFRKLGEAVKDGHIVTSQLLEQDRNNVTGVMEFEVRTSDRASLEAAMAALGDVLSRQIDHNQNALKSKVRFQVTLVNADTLAPRETTTVGIEVADVDKAFGELLAMAAAAGGRTVESHLSKDRSGRVLGKVVLDVPLGKGFETLGSLANEDTLVPADQGLWGSVKDGLSTSLKALLFSLKFIIMGLFVIGPWAALLYGVWRLIRRRMKSNPV
jgi:hypothetical protein